MVQQSRINWKTLLLILAVTFGLPFLLSLPGMGGMRDYAQLQKPPLSPPGWLFGVVWTILYLLMGIAAYLVWQTGDEDRTKALKTYYLQLAVNAIWTPIYFWLQLRLLAFIWLLLLIALVVLTLVRFYPISKTAAFLLLPYLPWLAFAAYLNFGTWLLNG